MQLQLHSGAEGLVFDLSLYLIQSLWMQVAMALCIWAGLSEPKLLVYAISTKVSCIS